MGWEFRCIGSLWKSRRAGNRGKGLAALAVRLAWTSASISCERTRRTAHNTETRRDSYEG